MKKPVGFLIACTLLAWAVAAYPGKVLQGDGALVCSAAAMLICLLPAAATLAWACRSQGQAPDQQLLMALGGTTVRMVFVLGVALVLYFTVPSLQETAFWIWLIAFYLVTLALEVGILVSRQPAARNEQGLGQEQV